MDLLSFVNKLTKAFDKKYLKKDEAPNIDVGQAVEDYLQAHPVQLSDEEKQLVYNLYSTTPSGMLESDVNALIDSKLNSKIETLPQDVKVVYKYEPKPFFSGLIQPPVTATFPVGQNVEKPYNSDEYYYDYVYPNTDNMDASFNVVVAIAQNKIFTANCIRKKNQGNSTGDLENVLSLFEYDNNGSIINHKYIYTNSCITNPERNLGSNQVVLGGIIFPVSAISINCFIETG